MLYKAYILKKQVWTVPNPVDKRLPATNFARDVEIFFLYFLKTQCSQQMQLIIARVQTRINSRVIDVNRTGNICNIQYILFEGVK